MSVVFVYGADIDIVGPLRSELTARGFRVKAKTDPSGDIDRLLIRRWTKTLFIRQLQVDERFADQVPHPFEVRVYIPMDIAMFICAIFSNLKLALDVETVILQVFDGHIFEEPACGFIRDSEAF